MVKHIAQHDHLADNRLTFDEATNQLVFLPRILEQAERIEQIAESNNFQSPQPVRTPAAHAPRKQRRYKTGRNRQINIKATPQVIERLDKMADAQAGAAGGTA
jgi:hypothetical protein